MPDKWGHALITPDGQEIQVPKLALLKLRKMGLLERRRARLSPLIHGVLQNESLANGLRRLLGSDLSGPAWLSCKCRECTGGGWND
jgi:hypothetical protein